MVGNDQESLIGGPLERSTSVQRSSFAKRLVISLILFNLLVMIVIGSTLRDSFVRAEISARIVTQNISQVLDQSFTGSIREADLGLLAVKNEYEQKLAEDRIDEAAINAFITREFSYLPQLGSMRIADARGIIRYGTKVDPNANISVLDRDYYVRLRDEPNATLVFSTPLLGRISLQWVIIFARRLNQPNGSFAGVVYGTLLLDSITRQFRAIHLGERGVIALHNDRLELVARHPALGRPEDTLGKKQVSPELDALLTASSITGTHFSPTCTDNTARLITYRKLAQYPFYVIVGVSRGEYLAGFWRDVVEAALFLLLSLITTSGAGFVVYRTRQREHDMAMSLAKQQEKYRIVADNTIAWEFWTATDGSVVYSSPSAESQTGRKNTEFYADPGLFERIVHPDDRELYANHLQTSPDGSGGHLCVFRILHADGTTRWMEHVCHPVADAAGRPLGIRGSNRDISKRKQAELAREEALARVRTLEGIIPICSYCKKIRDSQNTWNQLEAYITEHSEAKFSHGICPRCFEEHRRDFE